MFAHVYVDSKIKRDEPLIYRIPIEYIPKIIRGSLVVVSLRNKRTFGIVFKITKGHGLVSLRSPIKPIVSVITDFSIIQPYQRDLARWLANTYAIHFAQALFSIVPNLAKTTLLNTLKPSNHQNNSPRAVSIRHIVGQNFETRLEWYRTVINMYHKRHRPVLLLVPSVEQFPLLKQYFPEAAFFDGGLNQTQKTEIWLKCLSGQLLLVIGTRSAIFLPLGTFRLIIGDRPLHPGFFENRQPRYGVWLVAIRLVQLAGVDLVFGDEVAIPFFKDDTSIRWIHSSISKPNITVITPPSSQSITNALIHQLQKARIESCLIVVPSKGEAIGYRCFDCQHTSTPIELKRCPHCQSTRLRSYGLTTNTLKQELIRRIFNLPFEVVDLDHPYVTSNRFVIATQKIFDYTVKFDYSFVVGIESKVRSPDLLSPELFYRYIKQITNRTVKEVTIISRDDLDNFLFHLENDRQAYQSIINLRKQMNAYPFGHTIRLSFKKEPSSQLMNWVKNVPGVINVVSPHKPFFNRAAWQIIVTTTPVFRFNVLKTLDQFTSNVNIEVDPFTLL